MNRQVTLAAKPDGVIEASHFELREVPAPTPAAGDVLVRTLYLSIDPYVRPLLSSSALDFVGTVVPGDAVGQVVTSNHPWFRPGELVEGILGWQDYAAAPWYLLRKLDPQAAPVSTALGILGASGLTAYFGLFEVARIAPGDTVVVSAAAGAVGSAAVQLARLTGCRVIGVAGSDEKVRYLMDDLGVDAAFNYKSGETWPSKLGTACPFGVDVYFDNVGGCISDTILRYLNTKARVAVCGQISEYDSAAPAPGSRCLALVLEKRARVEGFLVSDFAPRFPQALAALGMCFRSGLLRNRETIEDGLENAPRALVGLLRGRNIGKQLVRVHEHRSGRP
jgi:NADPH-dependent curcumin reductase CurA